MSGASNSTSFDQDLSVHLDRLKERFLVAAAKGGSGRLNEINSLIELGADLDFRADDEEADAAAAASTSSTGSAHGDAAITADGNCGDTPLIAATRAGHEEVVSLLMASGADPNRFGAEGETALHVAASLGYEELYALLVANGADEEAQNSEGLSARQIAEQCISPGFAESDDEISQSIESLSSAHLSATTNNGEYQLPLTIGRQLSDGERIRVDSGDDDVDSSTSSAVSVSASHITSLHLDNEEVRDALAVACEAIEEIERERDELRAEINCIGADSDLSTLSIEELEELETKLRKAVGRIAREKENKIKERSRELEKQEQMRYCVICIEAPKTVLLLPCRHLCVCSTCSERSELTHCPLCRKDIESKINTYA